MVGTCKVVEEAKQFVFMKSSFNTLLLHNVSCKDISKALMTLDTSLYLRISQLYPQKRVKCKIRGRIELKMLPGGLEPTTFGS